MESTYKTLTREVYGEIIEKKSRFIASVFPADSIEEAQAAVDAVKKKYHDARHNCYAYIIGDDSGTVKYSDDGEPQGTAGRPMLEVLKGNGLTYVTAVVTRYFGGILLGTGGLSRAYSGALTEALNNADIVTMGLKKNYDITAEYTLTGKLTHYFEKKQIRIDSTGYDAKVTYRVSMLPGIEESFIKDITELSGGSALIEKIGEGFGIIE